ncbi:hypothetical protein AGMMS49992_21050 [Clostridia bacterium]|nr:hypothetical protein AGMMS49992_21050 [Clostridia bacterium]
MELSSIGMVAQPMYLSSLAAIYVISGSPCKATNLIAVFGNSTIRIANIIPNNVYKVKILLVNLDFCSSNEGSIVMNTVADTPVIIVISRFGRAYERINASD